MHFSKLPSSKMNHPPEKRFYCCKKGIFLIPESLINHRLHASFYISLCRILFLFPAHHVIFLLLLCLIGIHCEIQEYHIPSQFFSFISFTGLRNKPEDLEYFERVPAFDCCILCFTLLTLNHRKLLKVSLLKSIIALL